MKYTSTTLKKLEAILETAGYVVRYEKGSFNSGYCLVEHKKIAVVNRFFDTEARCASLIDIITQVQPDIQNLPENLMDFHQKLLKNQAAE